MCIPSVTFARKEQTSPYDLMLFIVTKRTQKITYMMAGQTRCMLGEEVHTLYQVKKRPDIMFIPSVSLARKEQTSPQINVFI